MSTSSSDAQFDKVLGSGDILVMAFGAMIGWGWVISSGDWISRGGVLGAALGFVIGGLVIYFVGMTYAELTTAMPMTGGEHIFSYKALGPTGSFICTWSMIFCYIAVVCYEACAFPSIITYIFPGFLKGYLYTVAGFRVYASWLAVALLIAAGTTLVNLMGVKAAAVLQTVLTLIIGGVGILLIAASAVSGDSSNMMPQLFVGGTAASSFSHVLNVAVVTPFFMIGFNVIPQAASEINVPLKKIGKILILSIVLAVVFYGLVILAVGNLLNPAELKASMNSAGGLVTADAMAKAFHSKAMAKILIIGGMCGIITSWNSFLIGGSRALYSMAEACMIPKSFGKLSDKHKMPVRAICLIGFLSMLAPFAGQKMLVWICDAGNLGCCIAYCMVAVSFVILRKKAPEMNRPFKVKHGMFTGIGAIITSGFMVAMYIIPGSGSTLTVQEWMMAGAWALIGAGFYVYNKHKYQERFGYIEEVECVAEHGRRNAEKVRRMEHVLSNQNPDVLPDEDDEERKTA